LATNIVDLRSRSFQTKSSKCSQILHLRTPDFLSAFCFKVSV